MLCAVASGESRGIKVLGTAWSSTMDGRSIVSSSVAIYMHQLNGYKGVVG